MAYGYVTPYRRGSLGSGGGGSLFDLHRQMNSLFDELFDQGGSAGDPTATMTSPVLDVHQDENEIEITAELAGVKRDDIDLNVSDGVLTISGEKRSDREDSESGYRERSYGRFARRLTLPQNVDEDAIEADFEDGVLTITLPKVEKQRGRKIELGGKSSSRRNDAERELIEQQDKSQTKSNKEEARQN